MTPATATWLDAAALARVLDVTGAGAVAMFVGLVRDNNLGRRVLHLNTTRTSRSRFAGST